MASRFAWLSGDGLSVFAAGKLLHGRMGDISVAHSRLLRDVEVLEERERQGALDDTAREALHEPIKSALQKVR